MDTNSQTSYFSSNSNCTMSCQDACSETSDLSSSPTTNLLPRKHVETNQTHDQLVEKGFFSDSSDDGTLERNPFNFGRRESDLPLKSHHYRMETSININRPLTQHLQSQLNCYENFVRRSPMRHLSHLHFVTIEAILKYRLRIGAYTCLKQLSDEVIFFSAPVINLAMSYQLSHHRYNDRFSWG